MIEHAFALARDLEVRSVLVQADDAREVQRVVGSRGERRVIWLASPARAKVTVEGPQDVVLEIPDIHPSRTSALAIGLFLAAIHDHVGIDESVVCLSGPIGRRLIDTVIVTSPQRELPWLRDRTTLESFPKAQSRELARVLEIAMRFASEGREGKAIGTAFVLGDPAELGPYLRQLILNPCAGHAARRRNLHSPEFIETLREYSALDGAFIIDRRGVVQSAGTYLDAPIRSTRLPQGLGARHMATAAITMATSAIAVALSESSGTVTVFHDGRAILTLEQP